MELAIFGLALLAVLVVMCWKKFVVAVVAVLGVMLGTTIANSGGRLEEPSQGFTNFSRDAIAWIGQGLFGGDK
ncbi:hypothetical protein ABZX12_14800 [Kribbella sp. NPDC003505]|uniref:hypothetical protein n=1 Tax=Kribbella sp. NPDC003505 TaxID=3154448 RepID=UPI0033B45110